MSGLHFKGRASTWYRYYQSSRWNLNWKYFQNDVDALFINRKYQDVQDLFNKLRQTRTISEYEDIFEELRALVAHKNKGLSEEYFMSSFVIGLKDNIKNSVKMFRPQTLIDTVFLAKQEEARAVKPVPSLETKLPFKFQPLADGVKSPLS